MVVMLAGVVCALGLLPALAEAAPRAPQRLWVADVDATSVTLRWSGSADRFDVIRSGASIGQVRGNAVQVTNLRPATTYRFTVRSVVGGQMSARSMLVTITTQAAQTCDVVAAPGGDDRASGSSAAPVRTIRRALQMVGAGGSACLRGTFSEDVTIDHGGTPTRPLVVQSQPGYRAVVRGRMWVRDSANDVSIQRLTIDGRNGSMLPSPTVEGDRVSFVEDDVSNHRTGICFILGSLRGYGQARGVVLDRNRIHDCGVSGNNNMHGIYLENATGTRIVNNAIFRNGARGIQLYPNAVNTLILGNVINGNGEGVIFSGAHGFASSGNRVVGNVVAGSLMRHNVESYWPAGNPVGSRNVVSGNCLWGGRQGSLGTQVGFRAFGNTVVNPLFAAPRSGDFRVRSSTCVRYTPVATAMAPFS